MKFEVRKVSDSSYREIICVDRLDRLKDIVIGYEKEDFPFYQEYRLPLLIVDFNKPERNRFLTRASTEIDIDTDGIITIYDDHIE